MNTIQRDGTARGGLLRRLGSRTTVVGRRQLLETVLENRLRVIDGLIASEGSLASSITVEDVLRSVLDAAVEVSGAAAGSIDFFEARGDELAVTLHEEVGRAGLPGSTRDVFNLRLSAGERHVASVSLTSAPGETIDREARAALEAFAPHAARTLDRAKQRNIEKASSAYLEAANLVKSRFLTTISHELRTPLTSIIGYSRTLGNHWHRLDDDQKRDFVRDIDRQSEKLCRLVERILEAARVELQGISIEPVEHDVRHSVEKAVAPFMASDADRIVLATPSAPVEAEVDPFVVDQVVSNLVDNALRFTKGTVRVSLDVYRSSVTIAVTDEGPGIDPDQLNLVLEPLYRIDDNVASGTGLGLHIVRTLVEGHGGRGEIRSGPTGTSIAIKLPRTTGGRIQSKVPATGYLRRGV